MLLGFLIFTASTIAVIQLVLNAPVSKDQASTQPTQTSVNTVIEKSLPTVPPVSTPSPTPTPSSVTPSVLGSSASNNTKNTASIDNQSLYSLINAHRKENGLSQLKVHTSLEQSATKKLQEMIAEKYWQHENREGKTSWYLFEQSGYHYTEAGENLSFANNTAWNVFDAWVKSTQHNEQMLKEVYEEMGLASDCSTYIEQGTASCVVVLHLGKQNY